MLADHQAFPPIGLSLLGSRAPYPALIVPPDGPGAAGEETLEDRDFLRISVSSDETAAQTEFQNRLEFKREIITSATFKSVKILVTSQGTTSQVR